MNTESSNFWRYAWDHEDRLVSAGTRKQSVRYKYDALGRRIERNLGTGRERTKFTYDGEDVLVDDNAGTLTKYVNGEGIDNKLRQTTGSLVNYFLADHLGSTNGLADGTGALTSSSAYDSFGNPSNATFPSRYQFTGREFDSFTGLQYSRARFYDPKLGRFISEDPIGFRGGDVNLFAYVGNGPTNQTDPDGLNPRERKSGKYGTRGKLPGTNIPFRMDLRQEPYPNMHVFWKDRPPTVISHKGGWPEKHGGKLTGQPPIKYRPNLKPVVCDFLKRVRAQLRGGMGGVFMAINLGSGLMGDYDRYVEADNNQRTFEEQMCEDYNDAGPFIQTVVGMLPNPYQGCVGDIS